MVIVTLKNPDGTHNIKLEIIRLEKEYLLEDWLIDHRDELIGKWLDLEFKDEVAMHAEVLGFLIKESKLISLYITKEKTHEKIQELEQG